MVNVSFSLGHTALMGDDRRVKKLNLNIKNI